MQFLAYKNILYTILTLLHFRLLPIAFDTSMFSSIQKMVDLISDVIEGSQSDMEGNYHKGKAEGNFLKILLKKNKMMIKVINILH